MTLVQYAIVYQTAERERDSVEVNPKRATRTNNFVTRVTHLKAVGDFHSHPELPVKGKRSCRLSQADKDSMEDGNIGFVIAIDRDSEEREWRHLSKGSLLGSVHPFSLKISGWLRQEDDFELVGIHCPFALGLGR
jgi:proteasome lid subunit RPN8/RPN11